MKVKNKIIMGDRYYEIYDINNKFVACLCEYERRKSEIRLKFILDHRWKSDLDNVKIIDLTIEEIEILKSLCKIEDEVIYNMYIEIFNKKFNDESYSINVNILKP